MSEVRIYGASDDLVEIGGALMDEFGCYNRPWVGTLVAPDGDGLTVTAVYTNRGVWGIGVGPLEEGMNLPNWPIRFENSNGRECDYSATLVIDAPKGSTITEESI